MRRLIPHVALVGVLLVTACGAGRSSSSGPVQPMPARSGNIQPVAAVNLGHLWPFSVDHGTLSCQGSDEALFIAPDGTKYALNDKALQAGFLKADPIRAKGASGSQVSLGAVSSDALALCDGS